MLDIVNENEKREKQVEQIQMEYQLRIKLLEHQVLPENSNQICNFNCKVAKAQIEKSEVKAEMTQDRLEIMKELGSERERTSRLEETVKLLKQQAEVYQVLV